MSRGETPAELFSVVEPELAHWILSCVARNSLTHVDALAAYQLNCSR